MKVSGNVLVAFRAGRTAKTRGFERVSPYYENPLLDEYFFAGFDGKRLDASNLQIKEEPLNTSLTRSP